MRTVGGAVVCRASGRRELVLEFGLESDSSISRGAEVLQRALQLGET